MPPKTGRILGVICLTDLFFLGGVLFLCKKAFYVFLRTNQFLHLVPCLAVVRVGCFLLGQKIGILCIQCFDLRQFFNPVSSKAALAALCSVISSR